MLTFQLMAVPITAFTVYTQWKGKYCDLMSYFLSKQTKCVVVFSFHDNYTESKQECAYLLVVDNNLVYFLD